MQYLFDMMAGTSTGSILSTALSIKNPEGDAPLFWAEDCKNLYMTEAQNIFR
jgi:patatin-like phospholipase/acyl hydrolase